VGIERHLVQWKHCNGIKHRRMEATKSMGQQNIIGLLLAGSYLLGSLPFGLWIAKRLKGIDIRTLGSGNIGSTNVGRICGPQAGAIVFCLDVLKGLLPPLVAMGLDLDSRWQVAAGLLAIIGHNYSVWLGFKGGKGIATSLGALVGTTFKVVPLLGGLFLVTLLATRWVSLGSILCALVLPLCIAWLYPDDGYRLAFGITACIMAVYKHRTNIGRIRAGTESRVRLPWDRKR
jgi:acyl phosphate:glycerol-3-phosphate acyltransferase